MNLQTLKNNENEFVKRILAWQYAQVLGYENEKTAKEHAALIAIDYTDDSLYPLMIGKNFKTLNLPDDAAGIWSIQKNYIMDNYITKEYREMADDFWRLESIKTKYAQGHFFDSIDYVSKVRGLPKWTHAVQHFFENNGHFISVCWIIEVDSFVRRQNAIMHMAEHDALTGLYNRHKLSLMQPELINEKNSDIFYLVLDIDHFKRVNDTYGHKSGDLALIALAKRLENIFDRRNRDVIFRLGGDEFFVVIFEQKEPELIKRINKLLEPFYVISENGEKIRITVSVGFSEKIELADDALYKAKKNGRNNYARL